MKLYFITGNKNKLTEAQAIFNGIEQLDIDLPEIQEIDPKKIIEAKLNEAFKHKKGNFIVEDTGLYFDGLNGLPGPLIKWFLETIGNQGLYELANNSKNNKATAKTVIGYAESSAFVPLNGTMADKPEKIHFFEGFLWGKIVKPRGQTNFGWDPIFQPDGDDKTFAEMSREEKNAISMRRMALDNLKEFLNNR